MVNHQVPMWEDEETTQKPSGMATISWASNLASID
jgi:hypothetical protein